MGLPGHRRTSSDKRKRSAHFGLKKVQHSICPKCKKPVLSHRACAFCGFYQGREVVSVAALPPATPAKSASAKPESKKAVEKTAVKK